MLDSSRLEALGIFQEEDGQYYRHRIRTVNHQYDEVDPRAVAKGMLVGYDEELVPHPVILPLATDPASLEEARKKAVASGADFYHPAYGWLRGGVKREKDLPENMGGGTKIHSRRRVTVGKPRPVLSAAERTTTRGADAAEPSPAAPSARKGGSRDGD